MNTNNTENTSPFLSYVSKESTSNEKISSRTLNDTPGIQPSHNPQQKKIPVTLFTGYLGAGKTTVIINLIKRMPSGYSIAWLKNEMGNTQVDTELAQELRVATVKEMLQGCICHVMIGQLSEALKELVAQNPDRIVIETPGSATPAPVVWEIRKNPALTMDGVITVIDAKNFHGYVNKSPTLKLQAKFTDLILINKHEDLDEATLEKNLDDLYEINLDTPKIKTDHGNIRPEIVFGLESKLFLDTKSVFHHEEGVNHDHQGFEVDIVEIRTKKECNETSLLATLREKFPKNTFYRIKGDLNGK